MLKSLLDKKIGDERLSIRAAARQIGISHVTLIRANQGAPLGIDALTKVCQWLGIKVSDILEVDEGRELENRIAKLVRTQPGFAKILEKTLVEVDRGNLSQADLAEIVAYANYRLASSGRKINVDNETDTNEGNRS